MPPSNLTEKQKNPHARKGKVQSRVNAEQEAEIMRKATLYTKGNVSAWVLEASLNYDPKKYGTKKFSGGS